MFVAWYVLPGCVRSSACNPTWCAHLLLYGGMHHKWDMHPCRTGDRVVSTIDSSGDITNSRR